MALATLVTGCVSTEAPLRARTPPPVPVDFDHPIGARELAVELGLQASADPALHSLALEGAGGRIVLVDGTSTILVAGRRLEAGETLSLSADGDVPLLAADADQVRAAWHEALAEWLAREAAAAPPTVVAAPAPASTGRAPAAPPPCDPAWDVPLKRTWEGILVHHSATPDGNLEKFDKFHREEKGWLMVGYDFIICNGDGGPDGLVQVSDRWRKQIQGAHAGPGLKRYNDHWVGICLVGDFNVTRPTPRQMASLRRLVRWLQARCGIPDENVKVHRDVRDTECPGRRFPTREVLGDSPRAR
jgi:hypothetical protein